MRNFAGTALTVTDVAQWLSMIQAGKAFSLGLTNPGGAAQFSEIQLFNPVGSGKIAVVRGINVATGVTTQFYLTQYNTQLVTDAGAGINLLSGAAASVCHLRTASPAGIDGTQFMSISTVANQGTLFAPDFICQIGPGQGVITTPNLANNYNVSTFWWYEQ